METTSTTFDRESNDVSRSLSDEALLEAVAGGDRDALALLYERQRWVVYTVAQRITGDHEQAEDLTQEVFLRVWRRAETFDPARGRAGAWLRAVTRHYTLNHLRHTTSQRMATPQRATMQALIERPDPAANVEREAGNAEEHRVLASALGTLPAPQRQAIVAAFYGGLSHAQIAARHGLPFGTVKSRIRLGLRRLNTHLGTAAQ